MELFAPKYYKDFKCIADRCRHSCCIGWEIDIDKASLEKYEKADGVYGDSIRQSIERGETPHFRLAEDERCPHLDGRGLCRIICNLGEEYLCDICREHPRFYNFSGGRGEAGIGLSCEEAARIILSSDDYGEIEKIGEIEEPENGEPLDFDAKESRSRIYGILSDRLVPYPERLQTIYEEFGVCPGDVSDGDWRELISSLEYLDESHRELLLSYTSDTSTPEGLSDILERALAYFVYRHLSPSRDGGEARASLGFALFCERLLCAVARAVPERAPEELAQIISEELEYSEENTEAVKLEFWF
ncbi:MAG: hypothetical protein E7647_03170 [Ruminococcaceae bacterium]|nr:hypothetical protein [Oscillospiraceae bacterium]